MDKLSTYYREHAPEMDQLEPVSDGWTQIAERLDLASDRRRRKRKIRWMTAAAIVLLLALWGGGSLWIFQKNQQAEVFPDIALNTPEGNAIPLSSLKDKKVVLVKFWASWCNTCSEQDCEVLLPLYDQYKAKGFEIYAVSLDEDPWDWKYGIERDQLPWIQVSDLKGFASPVSQQMGVDHTHVTYLIDENRQIIGKNLSRQELEKKLMNTCE